MSTALPNTGVLWGITVHCECCLITLRVLWLPWMLWGGGGLQDKCLFFRRAVAFSLLGLTVPSLLPPCFALERSFFFFSYKYKLHNSLSCACPIKRSLGSPLLAAPVDGVPQRPQYGLPHHAFEPEESKRKQGSVETPLIPASQLQNTRARREPQSRCFSKVGSE